VRDRPLGLLPNMASGTDEISTDGKSLVTVGRVDKAKTAVD
jgi:hypothetical protein